MGNRDLLEKVLSTEMDNEIRLEIIRHIANAAGGSTGAVPQLKDCPRKLDFDGIYSRMTAVAGGTGANVARLLGISSQGFNNQKVRRRISGNSIIDFHLKTGVSVDWLLGSWDGNIKEYSEFSRPLNGEAPISTYHSPLKYLSLVEIYDQQTGEEELKWCLLRHRTCLDHDNLPVPADFSALFSHIIRYKDEAGTPDKVRNGKKKYFQVRKILAYVLGSARKMSRLDADAKSLTIRYKSGELERNGKTEFRLYSARNECLNILEMLAEQNGLTMVRPEYNSIAWDLLVGRDRMSPRDWIMYRLNSVMQSCNAQQLLDLQAAAEDAWYAAPMDLGENGCEIAV